MVYELPALGFAKVGPSTTASSVMECGGFFIGIATRAKCDKQLKAENAAKLTVCIACLAPQFAAA